MKRVFSYLLLAIPLSGICQQQKYNIKGTINGVSANAKMYLSVQDGSNWVLDSCRIKAGRFQFLGTVTEPQSAVLVLGHDGRFAAIPETDMQSVYLQNGTVQVAGKDSIAKARIWGTPLNAENQEKLSLLRGLKNQKDETKLMIAFVEKHPASRVSLDWLASKGGKSDEVAASYAKLSPALKNTETGKELGLSVKAYLATRPGQPAPDFALPDPNGKLIRLSDLKGKYVLLDFWASSCKPCRASHPWLKEAYEVLRKTGRFEILAVSTDRLKAPWVKAIQEDQIPWLHVADLHPGSRNIAAELYGVSILPNGFLIDPNGIILSSEAKAKLMQTKTFPDEKEKSEPSVFTTRLSPLSEAHMLEALRKEGLSEVGFKEDFQELDNMLATDIGEGMVAAELAKWNYPEDSLAIRKFLQGKPVELYIKKERMKQAFIAQHPDSFVSLAQLEGLENMYTADGYKAAFSGLSERLKKSSLGQTIQARFDKYQLSPTGKTAQDFSRNDQHGRRVRLSDYRGKLVLLDFWASWCVPCRATHPHLKELYAKYKSKGLEIVAVANEKSKNIEQAKKAWLGAIKRDDINWVHVLNDEGSDTMDILKDYGVSSIPTKLLLDKDGKILMRQQGGSNDEIEKLIEKLLD